MTAPASDLPVRRRRARRTAVLGTAASTGVVAATLGWELPAPLWLHLLAGALAGGTVLAVAGLARLAVRAPRTRTIGGLLAVAAVLGLVAPTTPAEAIPALTRAEIASVLATPVAAGVTLSGDEGSLVDRSSIGREGLAFLDQPGLPGAARAYVGIGASADEHDRVLLGVREWVRLGGLQRSAVLIAVPTGSGWVNTPAVLAAEEQADGDVTALVVQYAQRPSWMELVLDRGRATRVARATLAAVQQVLARVPADHRPRVVLFGESLGADAVAEVTAPGVAACLAAGRPGSHLTGGSATSCTDVANADDPVVEWDQDLLWSPRGADLWVPVATFWRTSAELLVALDQGVGHGHSYLGSVADDWADVWPTDESSRV